MPLTQLSTPSSSHLLPQPQGLLVRDENGRVTYRQRGEDLEVSQKLLNIEVKGLGGPSGLVGAGDLRPVVLA
jgi:hypothetical protein